MAISSHGTTFAFVMPASTFYAKVLSISVEEAEPELVDMTSVGDQSPGRKIVSTGDVTSPARVTIEYLRGTSDLSVSPPFSLQEAMTQNGSAGTLVIAHQSLGTIQKEAIVNGASTEMAVGDAIRGRMSFTITRSN